MAAAPSKFRAPSLSRTGLWLDSMCSPLRTCTQYTTQHIRVMSSRFLHGWRRPVLASLIEPDTSARVTVLYHAREQESAVIEELEDTPSSLLSILMCHAALRRILESEMKMAVPQAISQSQSQELLQAGRPFCGCQLALNHRRGSQRTIVICFCCHKKGRARHVSDDDDDGGAPSGQKPNQPARSVP